MRSIFEVFDRDIGYEIGFMQREPWWHKMAARNQMREMLEDILAVTRVRQWKSGRTRDGRGGGSGI